MLGNSNLSLCCNF